MSAPNQDGGEWEPTVKPIIVCAANRNAHDGRLVLGARHWDTLMRDTIRDFLGGRWGDAEQGFIDQFGRFYVREEAMQVARQNNQIRWPDDMLSEVALHSEDLY